MRKIWQSQARRRWQCTIYNMYVCTYVCRFQNVVLRCPTPRIHCFPSSHWPSFRFLSLMAFLIPSIQFFFGLPRALFCMYVYIGFKTLFYVVRHLDSTASYLPTSLHLGFFRSWLSLYLPSSFSSIFLVLSFVCMYISVSRRCSTLSDT